MLHILHGPEHAFKPRPFHIRADHLIRKQIELLLRTVGPKPVEQALLGADDELLVL